MCGHAWDRLIFSIGRNTTYSAGTLREHGGNTAGTLRTRQDYTRTYCLALYEGCRDPPVLITRKSVDGTSRSTCLCRATVQHPAAHSTRITVPCLTSMHACMHGLDCNTPAPFQIYTNDFARMLSHRVRQQLQISKWQYANVDAKASLLEEMKKLHYHT